LISLVDRMLSFSGIIFMLYVVPIVKPDNSI